VDFKKGQVTIFIIIGIILVISIGVFIYLYQAEVIRPFEEVVVPSVQKAPSEIRPVQDFVTACVETVGKEGLRKIGDYGGYVDTSQFLYNPFVPTEGDAVQFSPDSGLIIPYWWYLKSSNDCTGECSFSSMRPELHRASGKVSIESQLDQYINENLEVCLAGFAPFAAQNFEFQKLGPVETETTIAKEQVYFLVKYPLRISRADQSWSLNEYLAELDLNLGRIYELGTEIVNLQAEHQMLEKFTVELIASFSGVDKNMLPPTSDIDVSLGQGVIWFKSRVADGLKEVLASYVPMLQVGNTRLYLPIDAPEDKDVRDKELYKVLYNRNMLIPLENEYRDVSATLSYIPWWNIYFDANCEGEVCMAQSVSSNLRFLQIGLQKYDFAYDVSYPVLVELRNPDALKGEGYSFKFFIEANVRNNFPMPSVFEPLEAYEMSFNSMLCDQQQRTSGNVTIFVRDARNQKGVDDALVGYTCGRESCTLGQTSDGVLVAQLPRCLGGLLAASKLDYETRMVPLDVLDDRPLDAEILLEPYRYMDFTVKKYLLSKGASEWSLDANKTVNQAMDEDTIIMLRRKADRLSPPFATVAEVCGMPNAKTVAACGSPPSESSEGIALIPGEYEVSIYSMKFPKPGITIPRDLRTAGSGLIKEEFYVPEEPIVFDESSPFPSGFASFNWSLTAEQLDSGNAVEFYYINVALDKVPKQRRKIEDLGQIGKALEYSTFYKNALKPRIFRKSKAKESTITVKVE
jgi:hypothetical protein